MTAENANRRQAVRASASRIDRAGDATGDPINLPPISPLGQCWAYRSLSVGLPLLDQQTVEFILFGGLSDPNQWPVLRGVD
jgi:hypothetical protein